MPRKAKRKDESKRSTSMTVHRAPKMKVKGEDARTLVNLFRTKHQQLLKELKSAEFVTIAGQKLKVATGSFPVDKKMVNLPPPLTEELKAMRSFIRAGLGNEPIHLQLPANLTIVTTVTSGVVNAVLIQGSNDHVDLQNWPEYSSVLALFDEAKYMHGKLEFIYNQGENAPATGSQTGNALCYIGYDPADNTTATSANGITQLAQHKPINPMIAPATSTTETTNVTCLTVNPIHTFKFNVPEGVMDSGATSTNQLVGRQWFSIDNTIGCGYIKIYHAPTTPLIVTAVNAGGGQIFINIMVRCRT